MTHEVKFSRRVFDGQGGESAVIGIASYGREFVSFSVDGRDFIGTPEFAEKLGLALVAAAGAVRTAAAEDGGS